MTAMSLSQKAIDKYKKIYKKVHKEDITDAEAREQGERLVRFFKILIEIDEREHIVKK